MWWRQITREASKDAGHPARLVFLLIAILFDRNERSRGPGAGADRYDDAAAPSDRHETRWHGCPECKQRREEQGEENSFPTRLSGPACHWIAVTGSAAFVIVIGALSAHRCRYSTALPGQSDDLTHGTAPKVAVTLCNDLPRPIHCRAFCRRYRI